MAAPYPQPSPANEDYYDAQENPRDAGNTLRNTESIQSVPATFQPVRSHTVETEPGPSRGNPHPDSLRTTRRARSSSIRIRRLPSSNRISTVSSTIPEIQVDEPPHTAEGDGVRRQDYATGEPTGRKRSFSAPERRDDVLSAIAAEQGGSSSRPLSGLTQIDEGTRTTDFSGAPSRNTSTRLAGQSRPSMFGRLRSGYASGGSFRQRRNSLARSEEEEEYDDEVANLLDVVDPEVSTLSTLTNVQNSLFIPDLSIGRFSLINRRPVYDVSKHTEDPGYSTDTTDELLTEAEAVARHEEKDGSAIDDVTEPAPAAIERRFTRRGRAGSITSQLSESHFAVLPHGVNLDGWTKEDRDSLNDHVRHMLHSRRSKFKRGMKGFGKYISRPLGFFVTLYAFLITVFGLVWVLFLIGWISGGNDARHKYLINVIDNVLVALFAVMGDGLAPFRAVDTYHMCFIAHYATLTWRKRREGQLPKLENRNDLPTAKDYDPEADADKAVQHEQSVLSPKQQKRLEHHQKKFARSHTYYKPHETTTHYAFSIRLLITITVLLDCHSLLQISLGAVTWGWNWHTRPAVVTTVILCCSISVNILAGVLISVGDKRSRKTEVVEQMFRQQLTQEAIKKVERHKREKVEKERADKLKKQGAYEGT